LEIDDGRAVPLKSIFAGLVVPEDALSPVVGHILPLAPCRQSKSNLRNAASEPSTVCQSRILRASPTQMIQTDSINATIPD
jgi:hypothetical protein